VEATSEAAGELRLSISVLHADHGACGSVVHGMRLRRNTIEQDG